jgi:hypothetical protein
MLKDDPKAKERYRFHQKVLSKIKGLALVVYYVLVPFLQSPDWCTSEVADMNKDHDIIFDCQAVRSNTVKYSNLPKLAPWFTGLLDILCLSFFAFFRGYKLTWRAQSKKDRNRTISLIVLLIVCLTDISISMARERYPYLTNFLRPVVVMIFMSSIRSNLKSVAFDLKDSTTVLAIIFAFIGFFTFSGYFLF